MHIPDRAARPVPQGHSGMRKKLHNATSIVQLLMRCEGDKWANSNMLFEQLDRSDAALAVYFGQGPEGDGHTCSDPGDSLVKIRLIAVVHQVLASNPNCSAGLNGYGKKCSVLHINTWPLSCVDRTLSKRRHSGGNLLSVLFASLLGASQRSQEFRGERRIFTRRMNFVQCTEVGQRGGYVAHMGEEKQCVRSSTNKPALNRWPKNRCEYCGDSANRRPSIPVYLAGATEHPTLTDSVQHAHFLTPPWISCHSETAQFGERHAIISRAATEPALTSSWTCSQLGSVLTRPPTSARQCSLGCSVASKPSKQHQGWSSHSWTFAELPLLGGRSRLAIISVSFITFCRAFPTRRALVTLANVKPPRDLRTKVPAVAEIPGDR